MEEASTPPSAKVCVRETQSCSEEVALGKSIALGCWSCLDENVTVAHYRVNSPKVPIVPAMEPR